MKKLLTVIKARHYLVNKSLQCLVSPTFDNHTAKHVTRFYAFYTGNKNYQQVKKNNAHLARPKSLWLTSQKHYYKKL